MTNKGGNAYFGLSLNVITLFTESIVVVVLGNELALCCVKNNMHLSCTREVIGTIVHLWSRNQNKMLIYFGTFDVEILYIY